MGAVTAYTLRNITEGHTIHASFAVVSASEEKEDLPRDYRLGRNYPNPFSPATTIAYDIAEPSDVRLVVHDLLGREVAVLGDKRHAAGRYETVFDASGLASGVYLYTLRAGDFTQTKRLVLLK